jgi:hypothetical protein
MKKNILLILLVTLFSWHGQAYDIEERNIAKGHQVDTLRAYEALKIILSTASSQANDLNKLVICKYIIEKTEIINSSDSISKDDKDGLKLVDDSVGGVANIYKELNENGGDSITDYNSWLFAYNLYRRHLFANKLNKLHDLEKFPKNLEENVERHIFVELVLSLQQQKILADIHNSSTGG